MAGSSRCREGWPGPCSRYSTWARFREESSPTLPRSSTVEGRSIKERREEPGSQEERREACRLLTVVGREEAEGRRSAPSLRPAYLAKKETVLHSAFTPARPASQTAGSSSCPVSGLPQSRPMRPRYTADSVAPHQQQ